MTAALPHHTRLSAENLAELVGRACETTAILQAIHMGDFADLASLARYLETQAKRQSATIAATERGLYVPCLPGGQIALLPPDEMAGEV